MLAYHRANQSGDVSEGLSAYADFDFNYYRLKNIAAPNGYRGASGTVPIITKIEPNSNGCVTWWTSQFKVSGGIITAIPPSSTAAEKTKSVENNDAGNNQTIFQDPQPVVKHTGTVNDLVASINDMFEGSTDDNTEN